MNRIRVSCLASVGADRREDMIDYWRERLEPALPDQPDLIILPERCERASRQTDLRELSGDDPLREHFRTVAVEHHCNIAYAAARLSEAGERYNSTQLIDRAGNIVGAYDKNHLTPDEYDAGLDYGTTAPVFDLDFGRVAAVICFDLNFPELMQQYVEAKPDLLAFSSLYHGGLEQAVWAYSCRSYFAGAVAAPAPSTILSPLGEVVATSTNYLPYVTGEINLDRAVIHYDDNIPRLKAAKARHGTAITVHDPGLLGAVLLTSESPEVTAAQVVEEFQLELLDEYLARVRAHRAGHLLARVR